MFDWFGVKKLREKIDYIVDELRRCFNLVDRANHPQVSDDERTISTFEAMKSNV